MCCEEQRSSIGGYRLSAVDEMGETIMEAESKKGGRDTAKLFAFRNRLLGGNCKRVLNAVIEDVKDRKVSNDAKRN